MTSIDVTADDGFISLFDGPYARVSEVLVFPSGSERHNETSEPNPYDFAVKVAWAGDGFTVTHRGHVVPQDGPVMDAFLRDDGSRYTLAEAINVAAAVVDTLTIGGKTFAQAAGL